MATVISPLLRVVKRCLHCKISLLAYLQKRLAFRLQLQDVASLLKGRENIKKMTEKLVKTVVKDAGPGGLR